MKISKKKKHKTLDNHFCELLILTMSPKISCELFTLTMNFWFLKIGFKNIREKASKQISIFPIQYISIHKTVTKKINAPIKISVFNLWKHFTPDILCTFIHKSTLTIPLILHKSGDYAFKTVNIIGGRKKC